MFGLGDCEGIFQPRWLYDYKSIILTCDFTEEYYETQLHSVSSKGPMTEMSILSQKELWWLQALNAASWHSAALSLTETLQPVSGVGV